MFYNPAMALDRDLGVAFVRAWAEGAAPRSRAGWDMLAATGVRGLRLLAESEAFGAFRLSERNPEAARVLSDNAAPLEARGARAVLEDALEASVPPGAFDYVDVDPYGSPAPYVRRALEAVRDGGVLALTATDLPVLAGAQRLACERRYGARPLRGRLGPEGGLRILIAFAARLALERGREVRPCLAYAEGHHLRVYLGIDRLERPSSREAGPVATVREDRWEGPPLPGPGPFGPFWMGPLHDAALVGRLRTPETAERGPECSRWIDRFREEAGVPAPFFYEPNRLAERLRLPEPPSPLALVARLRNEGFAAARAHAPPGAFRTDAPRRTVEALTGAVAATLGPAQSQKARVRA